MTFNGCCRAVLADCKDPYAKAYAEAGLDMTDAHEIKVQALYVLSNISRWRGDLAKAVRTELKLIGGVK